MITFSLAKYVFIFAISTLCFNQKGPRCKNNVSTVNARIDYRLQGNHETTCAANYTGTSGRLEVTGTLAIFNLCFLTIMCVTFMSLIFLVLIFH